MLLKPASVVKNLTIVDADAVRDDPEIKDFIEKATRKLGRKGRFVLRLSGIPQENSVLAEGKSRKLCKRCIEALERLLFKKNYMDHEHEWEILSETDYGEMDYCSYGGPVDRFVVTTHRCRLCGALYKDCRGDLMGEPDEYLEITEEERRNSERLLELI